VRARILGFPLNGAYCRFPHLEVVPQAFPLATLLGSWFLRLTGRPFSSPGDSGSWVYVAGSFPEVWIGMVVGGDPDFTLTSVIAEAQPLVEYFAQVLRHTHHPMMPKETGPLVPVSYL
jgi:hypothetical protein